jgi:hypothetical protein
MQQLRVIALDAEAARIRLESGLPFSIAEQAAAWRRTYDGAMSGLQAFGSYVPENEAASGSSQASASFPCHHIPTSTPAGIRFVCSILQFCNVCQC